MAGCCTAPKLGDPAEIKLKLMNWSHKHDFNTDSFFNLWNAVDEFNYSYLCNFHPLEPATWPKLTMVDGSLSELLNSGYMAQLSGEMKVKKRKSLFSRIWKEIKAG